MADRLGENGAIKFAQESTADVGTVSRLAGAGQIEADIRRLVSEGFYTTKVAAYTVRGRLINAALDAISIFSPSSLFANSEVGAWYDPSDLTTLYQDSAGTTPVTAVEQPVGLMLDKSGNENHASQTTSASRPTLKALYNRLTYTEQFDNAAWVKANVTITANATTAPDGTTTADKLVESANTARHIIYSNFIFVAGVDYTFTIRVKAAERQYVQISGSVTATSSYANFDISSGTRTAGTVGFGTITADSNGFYLITVQFAAGGGSGNVSVDILTNSTAVRGGGSYAGDGTSGIYIWGADLRIANDGVDIPAYQRVAAATDYDTVGFPVYLSFDGTDDGMVTNSIDFTGTDKMTVWTGVRKLSDDGRRMIFESATSTNPSYGIEAPSTALPEYIIKYTTTSAGVVRAIATTYAAPITNVISASYDLTQSTANNAILPKVNAEIPTLAYSGTPVITDKFSNSILYIGSRGGAAYRLNGRLYSLIVRGAQSTDAEITNTETWVNNKTGAY